MQIKLKCVKNNVTNSKELKDQISDCKAIRPKCFLTAFPEIDDQKTKSTSRKPRELKTNEPDHLLRKETRDESKCRTFNSWRMHRLSSETGDSGVAEIELNPLEKNTGTGGDPTGIEPHPLGNVPTINAGLLFFVDANEIGQFWLNWSSVSVILLYLDLPSQESK